MLSQKLKARLRDPAYLDGHLAAAAVVREIGKIPWYDAHFLRRFEAAKQYLAMMEPAALDTFVQGFAPLRPPERYQLQKVDDLFAPALQEEIRATAKAIPAARFETKEEAGFGRQILRSHPQFNALQRDILPRVSEIAGRALEPGYTFLSLYGGAGRCDPHMDEPVSMYTLDYCIDQSERWPIHFSQTVDWPDTKAMEDWHPRDLLDDPAVSFTPHILEPGEAIFFCGSSQWHYRDAIAPGGFCHLLFLHFYPKGCHDLVWPQFWARYFDMPVLEPLCDIFAETQAGASENQA